MGLPVIVEAGSKTLAQERYNVKWISEQGVGMPVKRIKDLPQAIEELLQPANYRRVRRRIRKVRNRAVFEIPEVLGQILQARESEDALIGSALGKVANV